MIVGVSRALREAGCKARLCARACDVAVLTTGKEAAPSRGDRRRIPAPHLTLGEYDEVAHDRRRSRREMARRLAKGKVNILLVRLRLKRHRRVANWHRRLRAAAAPLPRWP